MDAKETRQVSRNSKLLNTGIAQWVPARAAISVWSSRVANSFASSQ